jgi:AcrR family transcriptional regulator
MSEPDVVEGSLRERQRLQVRADLQRAALRLFAEHGFHAVTTEAVASAAGVSHSTFFRHVRHKEDLLLSSVRASGPAIVSALAQRPGDESAAAALVAAILERSDSFEGDHEMLRAWRRAISSAPELMDRVVMIEAGDRERLVDLLLDRLPGQDTRGQARLLVHLMLAASEHAYTEWVSGPDCELSALHSIIERALTATTRGWS